MCSKHPETPGTPPFRIDGLMFLLQIKKSVIRSALSDCLVPLDTKTFDNGRAPFIRKDGTPAVAHVITALYDLDLHRTVNTDMSTRPAFLCDQMSVHHLTKNETDSNSMYIPPSDKISKLGVAQAVDKILSPEMPPVQHYQSSTSKDIIKQLNLIKGFECRLLTADQLAVFKRIVLDDKGNEITREPYT